MSSRLSSLHFITKIDNLKQKINSCTRTFRPAVPNSYLTTGSAVRNWYKVKTWLDQMFWQIYQKLILSGFLSSGNLCLINHLKLFWPHTASTVSDRKGATIQHHFWWFSQNIFFQNIKIKSSKYWIQEPGRLLKSTVVIFQALRNLSSLIDFSSLCNLSGLNSL